MDLEKQNLIKKINNGLSLKDVPEIYRDDDEVVAAAVILNGMELQYASDRLKDNGDIVFSAVFNNGLALQFASERLRNLDTFVSTAVENNGLALEFASDKLKNDINIVLNAVNNNPDALKFASEKWQKNPVLQNANKEVIETLNNLSYELKNFEYLPLEYFEKENQEILDFAMDIVENVLQNKPTDAFHIVYRKEIYELVEKTIQDKTKELEENAKAKDDLNIEMA